MSIACSELILKRTRPSAIAPNSESVRWRLLSAGVNAHTERSTLGLAELLLV